MKRAQQLFFQSEKVFKKKNHCEIRTFFATFRIKNKNNKVSTIYKRYNKISVKFQV